MLELGAFSHVSPLDIVKLLLPCRVFFLDLSLLLHALGLLLDGQSAEPLVRLMLLLQHLVFDLLLVSLALKLGELDLLHSLMRTGCSFLLLHLVPQLKVGPLPLRLHFLLSEPFLLFGQLLCFVILGLHDASLFIEPLELILLSTLLLLYSHASEPFLFLCFELLLAGLCFFAQLSLLAGILTFQLDLL